MNNLLIEESFTPEFFTLNQVVAKLLNENVSITVNLTTKLDDGNKRKKGETPIERIQKLEEKLLMVMGSETYKLIDKKHIALVTSPIKKTNLILKNVNFQLS